MKELNLGLRFLLELALLGAIGYGGFQLGTGIWRWVFAIGSAILVAMIWGIWVAPHAKTRLDDPWRLGLELLLFVIGVLALWYAQKQSIALLFAGIVMINLFLMTLWHQRL